MARKVSVRTVVNRQALTAAREGAVAAMEDLGQRFLAVAEVPDAPPLGKGLVETGQYGVWSDGRKVAGTATRPHGERIPKQGVLLIAGYGFPAHFLEWGTIKMPAIPFVTPAALQVIPQGKPTLIDRINAKLRRFRG